MLSQRFGPGARGGPSAGAGPFGPAATSDPRRFTEHLRPARQTEWVVYAKRPFAGPEQVLDYLGRYTHRIAIANQRLCALHDGSVRFHSGSL